MAQEHMVKISLMHILHIPEKMALKNTDKYGAT